MAWYKIDWSGTYSIESIRENKHKGIYAIYASQNRKLTKLLYIGETYVQNFAKRIKQHEREWFKNYEHVNKVVCLGIIGVPAGKKISHSIVLDIEAVLIHDLIPPCNTSSKKGYKGRDIIVINTGKGKGLLPNIVADNRELITLLKKYV